MPRESAQANLNLELALWGEGVRTSFLDFVTDLFDSCKSTKECQRVFLFMCTKLTPLPLLALAGTTAAHASQTWEHAADRHDRLRHRLL